MTPDNQWKQLLEAATLARGRALAPLTGVQVGAALLAPDGAIILGCNVESPSGIVHACAEHTAIFAGVAAGYRHFTRCAVVGDFARPIPPCGYCRQALLEFAPDAEILMANVSGLTECTTVRALMPHAYSITDRAD